MSARRGIGGETLVIELGLRAATCMAAEYRWGGRYRKFLILNRKRPLFWAEWIVRLNRFHWLKRKTCETPQETPFTQEKS